MPNIKKTLLKREISIPSNIVTDYTSATIKGNTDFLSSTSISIPSVPSTTFGSPSDYPSGQETIYQSGLCEFVFDSLTSKGARLPESFNFEIEECIDNLYRTGTITFVTNRGLVEHSNIVNTFEGETLSITLKSRRETGEGRVIKFGLYDMQTDPKERVTSYSLFEEPFFTNLHKESLGNSYSSASASQIIASILSKTVKAQSIKMVPDTSDPKFSSFILPNWSPNKAIKYLSQYGKKGPIKTFNISLGQKTVTIVGSLNQLMNSKIYPSSMNGFKMIPSVTENVSNAIKLGPYKILGVSHTDVINSLSGETVITFNHLGDPQKEGAMFDNNVNYEYTSNYKDKKTYMATLAGSFKDGVKIAKSPLGNEAFHKIQTKSNSKQKISMDADENELAQAKLISRFYQSFHDEVVLYTILPGIQTVNVGQVFDVILPSSDQKPYTSSTPVSDESLSGSWLLWKLIHKVVMMDGGRPKYEMHCYFLRTGFNKSSNFRDTDKM